ncbi:hypothetical protein DV451_001734 [Geotrichum candidum]|uniref:dTMP kinase n=1 Tax=Geotrichum candidum TaxID=1173061 RepID=A0A9P5G892_GEOCN|nr:hypothetical protein DV451_001734 [Geotrichum candidum]KAF5107174.1 hypothetical protein DV453_003344 [Geotrichum candidum]
MSIPRGKLILIEGLDRSGKSTQCDRLTASLGANTVLVKFPDRTTPIGHQINAYLTSASDAKNDSLESMHLLFSANRWELASTIKSHLAAGRDVVLDRYVYSGIAYSYVASRASPDRQPLSLDWLQAPDLGLLKPDIFFFLNVSEEEQVRRAGFGEERYEKREFQRSVADIFHKILPKGDETFHLIDADNSLDIISNVIYETVAAASQPGDFQYYTKIV